MSVKAESKQIVNLPNFLIIILHSSIDISKVRGHMITFSSAATHIMIKKKEFRQEFVLYCSSDEKRS